MEEMRLNKYLASCGICSRRDADKLIEQGAVTVNGMMAVQGMKVAKEDSVCVRGVQVAGQNKKVVLAYYKPVGVVCTQRDAHAERIVTEEIKYPVRVTYAGRLDKDSEGLLLLSNDGSLIDAMMRGANLHEKEYVVRTVQAWTSEEVEQMRQGVYLEELEAVTRPCKIETEDARTLRMVLTQGLNRQIRRMCKTQGHEVESLKRTRVMNITLQQLKPGEYRELTKEELTRLYEDCGLAMPEEALG